MAKVICPEPGSQLTLASESVPSHLPAYTVSFTSSSDGRESVEDVARAAICSLGSFDRALQDYYQQRLNMALGGAR